MNVIKLTGGFLAVAMLSVTASSIGSASKGSAAAATQDNAEYIQCMNYCVGSWLEKDEDCSEIGAKYGVSGWEYQTCVWDRDREFEECQAGCERSYPPN